MKEPHETRVGLDIIVWIVIFCLMLMAIGHYAWHARIRP